jgi:hypothetical protein
VFRIELTLRSTEEGGRQAAIASDYRSFVRFAGFDDLFGVEVELDAATLNPGATGLGTMRLWAALPHLPDEAAFELLEGRRVIGAGRIVT